MTNNDDKETHLVNGLTNSDASPDLDATFLANIFINSPIGIYIVQDGSGGLTNRTFWVRTLSG